MCALLIDELDTAYALLVPRARAKPAELVGDAAAAIADITDQFFKVAGHVASAASIVATLACTATCRAECATICHVTQIQHNAR